MGAISNHTSNSCLTTNAQCNEKPLLGKLCLFVCTHYTIVRERDLPPVSQCCCDTNSIFQHEPIYLRTYDKLHKAVHVFCK